LSSAGMVRDMDSILLAQNVNHTLTRYPPKDKHEPFYSDKKKVNVRGESTIPNKTSKNTVEYKQKKLHTLLLKIE
jgi:hypothetical protein